MTARYWMLAAALLAGALYDAPASAAGGLDPSFGSAGVVRAPGHAYAVAAGLSGRVLTTGEDRQRRLAVSVLRADGRPDARFGRAGRVTLANVRGSWGASGRAVAAGAGGRVMAAGIASFEDPGGFITARPLVVRLTPTGRRDRTFGGGDGEVVLDQVALRGSRSTHSVATGVVVLPGGKILVAGTAWRVRPEDGDRDPLRDQAFLFTRLNADGTLDRTFGRAGRLLVRFPGARLADLGAVAADRRGRVLAAGWAGPQAPPQSKPVGHLAVARLDTAGRLDPSFGTGGLVVDELPLSYSGAVASGGLAIQPDSKPVISARSGPQSQPVIRRLAADGKPDPAFGTAGQIMAPYGIPGPIVARGTAACPGLLALGEAGSAVAVSLTATGSLDQRFGGNGILAMPTVVSLPRPGQQPNLLGISGAALTGGRIVFSFFPDFGVARLVVPPPSCPPAP